MVGTEARGNQRARHANRVLAPAAGHRPCLGGEPAWTLARAVMGLNLGNVHVPDVAGRRRADDKVADGEVVFHVPDQDPVPAQFGVGHDFGEVEGRGIELARRARLGSERGRNVEALADLIT
jgi:hypothetical protein